MANSTQFAINTPIIPRKKNPAASGFTQMKTTAHRTPVSNSLPNSARTAVRKKSTLSPPTFLVTSTVNSKPGRYTARLPERDEYAATGPARNDNEANARAVRDWILSLFNVHSNRTCFFDLDQPDNQLSERGAAKDRLFYQFLI